MQMASRRKRKKQSTYLSNIWLFGLIFGKIYGRVMKDYHHSGIRAHTFCDCQPRKEE